MPRKGPAPRRELSPDPIYRSVVVTQLVNKVMTRGKRSTAERIVYQALDIVAAKAGTDDPVGTPNGLAAAPASGPDPTIASLARAVRILHAAGYAPDVTLRSLQATVRNGERIAVPGGNQEDAMNIVSWEIAPFVFSLDPSGKRVQRSAFARDGGLSRVTGDADFVGYPVNTGNTFMLAVAWGSGGPTARTMLTYSTTSDESDPQYVAATERFANKEWTPVAFAPAEVAAAAVSTTTVHG